MDIVEATKEKLQKISGLRVVAHTKYMGVKALIYVIEGAPVLYGYAIPRDNGYSNAILPTKVMSMKSDIEIIKLACKAARKQIREEAKEI